MLPSPVATPTVSPEQFRGEFSIFRDRRFINSCSKGPLADAVRAALQEYLDDWAREGSDWERWGAWVEEARHTFAGLIGVEAPPHIWEDNNGNPIVFDGLDSGYSPEPANVPAFVASQHPGVRYNVIYDTGGVYVFRRGSP